MLIKLEMQGPEAVPSRGGVQRGRQRSGAWAVKEPEKTETL